MAVSPSTIVQPPKDRSNAITVAMSARALFDLEAENKYFEENGLKAYIQHMIERENKVLGEGPAFAFVKSALAVNDQIRKLDPKDNELFDIVIVSRNHAQAGVRIINSINHHGLCLERMTLAGGTDPTAYLEAWKADLFLSPDENDVRRAIQAGFAAAVVYKSDCKDLPNDQLRIVFDGDSVLFSDEAERVYQQGGFPAFVENEKQKAEIPLKEGPLKEFASRIAAMQEKFYVQGAPCPIRTYILTARSGASAGKRAILTLREWGLKIDECTFNAGASKAAMLKAIKPHFFFDDSQSHVDAALEENIPAGRVPYGIRDEKVEAKPAAEKSKKRGRERFVDSEGAKGTMKEHFPVEKKAK